MIGPFKDEFEFLSNFYVGEPICYHGNAYQTAEHAFQAAKAKNLLDGHYIALSETPSIAKRRGRLVDIRPDWEYAKDRIMYEIVHEKFFQSGALAKKLMATGTEEIVEINTWGDRYWGTDPIGKGQNKLGKILMKVRNELYEQK